MAVLGCFQFFPDTLPALVLFSEMGTGALGAAGVAGVAITPSAESVVTGIFLGPCAKTDVES